MACSGSGIVPAPIRDSNDDTDLHRGFRNGITFEDASKQILANRSHLDLRNNKGRTVFHEAAKYSNLGTRVFKLLLDSGANLFLVDCEGSSLLHDVIKNPAATLEMVYFFLKQGLLPDLKDTRHCPPLAYVQRSSLSELDKNKLEVNLIQRIIVQMFKFHIFNYLTALNNPDINPTDLVCLNFCRNEELRTKYIKIINSCVRDVLRMGLKKVAHKRSVFDYVLAYCSSNPMDLDNYEFDVLSLFYHADTYPSFSDFISSMLKDSRRKT